MSDPAETVALIAALLYGLAIGSFSNVIIDRLPVALDEPNEYGELWDTRGWREVFGGRSRCSSCGIPVRVIDNIPVVSFIALRGRCRGCKEPIPRFHPLVEMLVPGLAVLAVWAIGLHPALIPTLWLVPAGVVIGTIDFNTLMVPTRVIWPTFFVMVALSVGICAYRAGTDVGSPWLPLVGALVGLAILAGPLFGIWWLHPKGMGFGDVRLAVLLGWSVGFVAMLTPIDRLYGAVFLTLVCLVVSSAAGLLSGLILQVGFGHRLPFGPGLIAGTLFCMMLAERILDPLIN